MDRHDIVVIGASAGGFAAIKALMAPLGTDFPAALFRVSHLPRGQSRLAEVPARASRLKVSFAEDGDATYPQMPEAASRDAVEASLWAANRLLEQQRSNIERTRGEAARTQGSGSVAEHYAQQAARIAGHADVLRDVLAKLPG